MVFRKTHGLSEHPLYETWNKMMRRCYNPADSGYAFYGAKGIEVEDHWHAVENFVSDMFPSYTEGLTLERKDVTGNYSRANCVWISLAEQQRNKRCYTNNQLGKAGINVYTNSRGTVFIQARIQFLKKRYRKIWSIGKYGYEAAILLAEDWLQTQRKNYGFGEKHGTTE